MQKSIKPLFFLCLLAWLQLVGCSYQVPPSEPPPPVEPFVKTQDGTIKVDHLGYLPSSSKIARISVDASNTTFAPSENLELRRSSDNVLVYTASPQAWNAGATDSQSGDKIWTFDFSSITTPGSYYVYDPNSKQASFDFNIDEQVYLPLLKTALKTFIYQRAGFEKTAAIVGVEYADSPSHLGSEQDQDCRLMNAANPNSGDITTRQDLSGGWYDAGDFNKYVNFADGAVHELLFAYEENPSIWGDDWQWPESGNQIPDLLDEVKYELDWLLKMQQADGGTLHKVASISWDFLQSSTTARPSDDSIARRYGPVTASATISATAAFAHAAIVYGKFTAMQDYASALETAARLGWQWLEQNPSAIPSTFDNAGFVNDAGEDSANDQLKNRLHAAIYLFALTHEDTFADYVVAHLDDALLLATSPALAYDGMDYETQNALIYYTRLSQANTAAKDRILNAYNAALINSDTQVLWAGKRDAQAQTDGYAAYLPKYTWGSNRSKSKAAISLRLPDFYEFANEARTPLSQFAEDYLHYLHGVNPLSQLYVTNLTSLGGENSVDQLYHLWFKDGSLWDSSNNAYGPPAGYLVGGANEDYAVTGIKNSEDADSVDLTTLPAAKRYRSFNSLKIEDTDPLSYQLNENSITYQASYVRLLSHFVSR